MTDFTLADLESIVAERAGAAPEESWTAKLLAAGPERAAKKFGEEAVEAGERFIAALPDHEFAIPGQLVADATVTEAEHRLLPNPRLVVQCELLLLEEG